MFRFVVATFLVILSANAASAALPADQQKCVNAMNKGGAKIAAQRGKITTACVKDAGLGLLPPLQTVNDCFNADPKGKITKAALKAQDRYGTHCTGNIPPFGLGAGFTVEFLSFTASRQATGVMIDLLGPDLDTGIVPCSEDAAACECQRAVSKAVAKLAATKMKEFVKCKRNALKIGKEPFPAGAMSSADLEHCIDDPAAVGSIADDAKGKIAKKLEKLGDQVIAQCTGVNTFRTFPGMCTGASGAALTACIDQRVECRVCLSINSIDGLNVDCDAFDDGAINDSCPGIVAETVNIPSMAEPVHTPGTPGVVVTNPKLLAQFGGPSFSLNNARYIRFHFVEPLALQPDAILVLIPGFEGGANDFKVLAENLIPRMWRDHGLVVEVWGFDRRTNQLEDTVGLDLAELYGDELMGVDWLFGSELSLTLHPTLAAGPNRRAQFYNPQDDVAFMANWTNLVFSRDIDAVVELARGMAKNQNAFLGGHSAGTGFAARYAATDFNLTGIGAADPGYAKLRGLVLLEGGGGSTGGTPLTADSLDRIEAKFDGGLFGAVRDNAPRCVDGTTPCTIATEAADCSGQIPPKCTLAAFAYSLVPGLLNPRILAAVEPAAIQGVKDPDGAQIILQVDQGSAGNNAVAKVPDLLTLSALPQATVQGGIGSFVDDDGFIAGIASFVATSVGAAGPVVGTLTTWLDFTDAMPPAAVPNNGPAPTTLPAAKWGQEKEVTDFQRLISTFYKGGSNFTDWYFPNAGPSTTSVAGDCEAGLCIVGNVGAGCTTDANCSQSFGLDSSALSIGRGRRDIENLTQAANIDIPVIGFGGSNGLATVPASFMGFAQSIATCAAPSCNGTARVVDALNPNPAFPTYGDVDGGYEAYISEGFAHVDVLTAEDDANNNVLTPLAAFLARNAQ